MIEDIKVSFNFSEILTVNLFEAKGRQTGGEMKFTTSCENKDGFGAFTFG